MRIIPALAPQLTHRHENCIFPFLWMRGEPPEVLREELAKIDECGIKAFCVESRPHPDFVGPGWWRDFDLLLEEARARGMKIWILDDAHFPTGMANGLIPQKYPERARQYAMIQTTDAVGPVPCAELDVRLMTTRRFTWMDFGKPRNEPLRSDVELLSVTAAQVVEGDLLEDSRVDLTCLVQDGTLRWDVPAGVWRICVCFTTYDFGSHNEYINYIDPDSVHTLIEAVYEPHYQHYKEEFGKTIAGFFSDEPGFYNTEGYTMTESIGRKLMALPWSREMPELLAQRLGADWKEQLPALWYSTRDEAHTAHVRYAYMDVVSSLYSRHFSCQLGEWCQSHGVEYVGHVVEDNNQHSRLGCGAAHFFRAIAGQHMSGIDNIGGQIIPGNPSAFRHGPAYVIDGAFFHYALGKLGASAAQIDPKKQGRAMCETFGAYGWNLGVKGMKWMTDYLILQGINRLVPHAFSMKDYPDDDCPPHFYARGANPQFPWFAQLMQYANRMCSLFSDGVNVPQAAILYHGEQEWMNDCMMIQEPARELLEHQIDFEFLPIDVLTHPQSFGTRVEGNALTVNGRTMQVLIVPETRCIGEDFVTWLTQFPQLSVLFVNSLPQLVVGKNGAPCPDLSKWLNRYPAVPLFQLGSYLADLGIRDAVSSQPVPYLGIYHYRKGASELYFLFNTSLSQRVDTQVTFPVEHWGVGYDGERNVTYPITQVRADTGLQVEIALGPYQSMVLVFDAQAEPGQAIPLGQPVQRLDLSRGWTLALTEGKDYHTFSPAQIVETLEPVNLSHPYFSGVMAYETSIDLSSWEGPTVFTAQYIYECAELFVNGVSAGKKLTPEYHWDVSGLCKPGQNTLRIEVVNTLTRDSLKHPGIFGPEREITEPAGMFGKVELLRYAPET